MNKHITFMAVGLFAVVGPTFGQQPKWAKKVAKSVFTVKGLGADGTLCGSSCGFFVSADGNGVSGFAPFRGASRAVVIDNQGKEHTVDCILGANDTYDLAKFKVAKGSVETVAEANAASAVGDRVWLVPYSAKKTPECIMGKVAKIEMVQDSNVYYTLHMSAPVGAVGCPVLNEDGDVIGLLQQPQADGDTVNYAVGARLATGIKVTGLSINDRALRQTRVKKALPDELDQATLTMYVAASTLDSADYAGLVDDFIAKFPQSPDGYVYRAQLETGADLFDKAAADMEKAITVADQKDIPHNDYAKLIYQKEVFKSDKPYAAWSLDKAADEADMAYKIKPEPVYKELKARIRFVQKRYDEACSLYLELTSTNLRSAELFYSAARCKELAGDTAAMVNLLDSAVATFNKPYLKAAAPYLLAKARGLVKAGKYRAAVLSFNEYEKLLPTELTDAFYYEREHAELEGKQYQQALDDIKKAISINPKISVYYAEKAMIEVRVGMFDAAISSAGECIAADPKLSDGHLFLGLAQCLKGNTTEGLVNLQKAKELGNEQADGLMEKYGKK